MVCFIFVINKQISLCLSKKGEQMANKTDKIDISAKEILSDRFLLKTVEILKVLSVSRGTFDKIKKNGSFPKPILAGARPRWKTEDVINWMKLNK